MNNQSAFDKVLGYIAENGLSDGDTLPPERTLAEELGLSRRELRAVLGSLEVAGRIYHNWDYSANGPTTMMCCRRCVRQREHACCRSSGIYFCDGFGRLRQSIRSETGTRKGQTGGKGAHAVHCASKWN